MAPAACKSPAVTGLPLYVRATCRRDKRAFKSCKSFARQKTAITSLAAVMSKPSSRGVPLGLPPSPLTMARNCRSLTSRQRRHVT